MPLLVAHVAAISPDAPVQSDAVQFASAEAQLADRGYALRATAEGLQVVIVLANERTAEGLSVHYNQDTEGLSEYSQHAISMRSEERYYLHGEELLEELSLSLPAARACKSYERPST